MKTITKEEVVRGMEGGKVLVVNVLAHEGFDKIHIRGSVSIPRKELEGGRWTEIDRGKEIVVHCSSYSCDASRLAAEFLEEKGFQVKAYEGGIKEWAESGLPTEGRMTSVEYLEERYGRPAQAAGAQEASE